MDTWLFVHVNTPPPPFFFLNKYTFVHNNLATFSDIVITNNN